MTAQAFMPTLDYSSTDAIIDRLKGLNTIIHIKRENTLRLQAPGLNVKLALFLC
jgi:hypothetical protein